MQIKSLSIKMDTTEKKSVGKDMEKIQENAFP